ncbi:MAG: GerAB/ArcD/ProY family transporter [Firmicutes bacterium]|nr:GerAB/ArcD/ProY family transporter [Bacillota bacterium]
MIRDGHISPRQVTAILTIIVLGKGLDSAILILVHWGHGAAELLLLVAEGLIAGAILLLLPLHKAQDKNLADVINDTFGRWIGSVICSLLFILLMADITINLEMDMQQIRMVFLPMTPTQVVLIVALMAMVIPAYYGIEVLGRTNLIMVLLLLGIAAILVPMTIPMMDLSKIAPVLGPGPWTLLKEGVLHVGFFGEYLTVLMLRPYVRDYESYRKSVVTAMIICLTVGFVAMLDMQLVFPYPTDDHLFFPFVEMARILYFGRFIQHVEALFALTWLAVALARLSLLVYILSLLAASMTASTNFRRFIPLLAACIYYGALMIPSLPMALDLRDIWLEKRGFPVLATIIVATIVVGHWKARTAQKDGPSDAGAGSGSGSRGQAQPQPRQPAAHGSG